MGIVNRKNVGVKYPEDLEGIDSFQKAAKLVKRMTYDEFQIYRAPQKHGLPIGKDIRLGWLCKATHEYMRSDIKSRYCKFGTDTGAKVFHTFHVGKDGSRLEVYKNKDGKIVCGFPLRAGNNWVCMSKAGTGTNHPGYGRCYRHEKEMTSMEHSKFWQQMGSLSKARSLDDIAKQAKELEEEENTLSADLSHLNIAKRLVLQRIDSQLKAQVDADIPNPRVSEKDIRLLKEIAVTASSIKKNIHFIEARGMIPVDQIGAILIRVLEAVTEGEEDQVRQRIAQKAMSLQNDLVLPIFEKDASATPKVPSSLGKEMLDKVKTAATNDTGWNHLIPKNSRVKDNKELEYANEQL